MNLDDIVEVKEVLSANEANGLLSKGWKLINVLQMQNGGEFIHPIITAYPVYVVGRVSSDNK